MYVEKRGVFSDAHATLYKYSLVPFIILLIGLGIFFIYRLIYQPNLLNAIVSVYLFFWLIATFIFTFAISVFAEFFADYNDTSYVDKSLTKIMGVSFIISSIGIVAELFFFLSDRLQESGFFYLGIIMVLSLIIMYYSIMAIYYYASLWKISVLGMILGFVIVLLSIASRYILGEIAKNMFFVKDMMGI